MREKTPKSKERREVTSEKTKEKWKRGKLEKGQRCREY
jgi:hypothetical protein